MTEHFANPSAQYAAGRAARERLDRDRAVIAGALGCRPEELFFTSCGTEGDNWALRAAAWQNRHMGRHIVTTAVEHSAVLECCKWLERDGCEVTYIAPDQDGHITAIAHESVSGNLPNGRPETAVDQTKLLYAGENRLTGMRLAQLDLPEGNSMRAPGEAPGLMALEMAMDEMAERLGLDPVAFRVRNDTQVDPGKPDRPFSQRNLVTCLKIGAEKFGWDRRNPKPGQVRDGHWLVGIGMAEGFRNNQLTKSGARVRLAGDGRVLLRPSGTEPVVRVMVEAATDELCAQYVNQVISVLTRKGHVIL